MQSQATLFISYSHHDEIWRSRFLSHLAPLRRRGVLRIWEAGDIEPGVEWAPEIQEQLRTADIAILLISPAFLASDFAVEVEMVALSNRHLEEGVVVIPVLIETTAWTDVPDLRRFQVLPRDGRALAARPDAEAEQELAAIARHVAEIAEAIVLRSGEQRLPRIDQPSLQGVAPVFISHAREDGDFAELAKLKLKDASVDAWIDVDRLTVGVDWRQEIDGAIRSSPALIAIMSPDARDSEYVTYEWAYGLGAGVKVLPLMLRQTSLHPRLATLQYLDFTNRVARPWSQLLSAILGQPNAAASGSRKP